MFALTKQQLAQAQVEDKIAEALADVDLDALDLHQPTYRAYELAAHAALVVLLAHDLGQTADVGADLASAPPAPARANGRHAPKARRRSSAHPLAKIGSVQCPHCGQPLKTQGQLERHLRTKHPSPAPAAA